MTRRLPRLEAALAEAQARTTAAYEAMLATPAGTWERKYAVRSYQREQREVGSLKIAIRDLTQAH